MPTEGDTVRMLASHRDAGGKYHTLLTLEYDDGRQEVLASYLPATDDIEQVQTMADEITNWIVRVMQQGLDPSSIEFDGQGFDLRVVPADYSDRWQ